MEEEIWTWGLSIEEELTIKEELLKVVEDTQRQYWKETWIKGLDRLYAKEYISLSTYKKARLSQGYLTSPLQVVKLVVSTKLQKFISQIRVI
jgi:hypothetical protein